MAKKVTIMLMNVFAHALDPLHILTLGFIQWHLVYGLHVLRGKEEELLFEV
jgi:hypothetical protein